MQMPNPALSGLEALAEHSLNATPDRYEVWLPLKHGDNQSLADKVYVQRCAQHWRVTRYSGPALEGLEWFATAQEAMHAAREYLKAADAQRRLTGVRMWEDPNFTP